MKDTNPINHDVPLRFEKDGKHYELYHGCLYNLDKGRTYIPHLTARTAGLTAKLVFKAKYDMDIDTDLTVMELLRRCVDYVKQQKGEVRPGIYHANFMVVVIKPDGFHELREQPQDMSQPLELVVSSFNCRMDAVRAIVHWMDGMLGTRTLTAVMRLDASVTPGLCQTTTEIPNNKEKALEEKQPE